jgi:H/ACA ribonucleoprotein complex subunit 4
MQELRRTRAGPFVESGSVTLHEAAYWFMKWEETKDDKLLKKFVQPMEKALALVAKVYVRDSAVDALCHGASLTAPGILSFEDSLRKGSLVAILTLKGEAIALGKAMVSAEEVSNMNHGVVATTERVIMTRGTYPKCWKSSAKNNE